MPKAKPATFEESQEIVNSLFEPIVKLDWNDISEENIKFLKKISAREGESYYIRTTDTMSDGKRVRFAIRNRPHVAAVMKKYIADQLGPDAVFTMDYRSAFSVSGNKDGNFYVKYFFTVLRPTK